MKKNKGEELPSVWCDSDYGSMHIEWCTSCMNYWFGDNRCKDRFDGDTSRDIFCHYKKSRFCKE